MDKGCVAVCEFNCLLLNFISWSANTSGRPTLSSGRPCWFTRLQEGYPSDFIEKQTHRRLGNTSAAVLAQRAQG